MKISRYEITTNKLKKEIKIALVSDLHDRCGDEVIAALRSEKPDYIMIPGDLTSRLDAREGEIPDGNGGRVVTHKNAFKFLAEASMLAPVFYSFGNHELCGHFTKKNFGRKMLPELLDKIEQSGAVLLDDKCVSDGVITVGGLTSGHTNPDLAPKIKWLDDFAKCGGFKVLLSHHPEYYPKYGLEKYGFDLILSGHAHGGQIRLFGRGVFAPSQGLFPKYTEGKHGSMIISRGLANTVWFSPRLFNPTETVIITVKPE